MQYNRFHNPDGRLLALALLSALVFCVCLIDLSAQQVIVNASGERIVIYPDGSWRKYEEADSVLLRTQLTKEQVFSDDASAASPYEIPYDNPDEIEEVIIASQQFYILTGEQLETANQQLADAIDEKFAVEGQLRQASENEELLEADQVEMLEDNYKSQTELVKQAKGHLKQAEKFYAQAQKVLSLPARKKEKALNKLMARHSMYYAGYSGAGQGAQHAVQYPATATRAAASGEQVDDGEPYQPRSGEQDYAGYMRPPFNCTPVRDEVDLTSEIRRIVIRRSELFTHTDPELRPYFRAQAHIRCSGQLSQIGDQVYLLLEFSIASPNAQKNFGILEEGSLLRVQLIDGEQVNLFNLQGDQGTIDPYTGHTRFIGRYLLDREQRRTFKKTELDRLRVVWSSGYDDYEVFNVDFLIDQLGCLESIN